MSAHPLLAASSAAATSANVTFWLLAVVSVAAALGMILARRAVHCAVLLAVVMLSLAVLYATAGAPFLAFVQIIVYTGAVLMLFLFVLMIVGVERGRLDAWRPSRASGWPLGWAAIGLLVLLALTVGHAAIGPAAPAGPAYGAANVTRIATLIFTRYFFPFEVTSALLITAALGAMVLAHRERTSPRPTQRELSRQRVAGGHPAPLPGPGTYARHNAVDFPALLPDGTPARLSVSPVLLQRGDEKPVPGAVQAGVVQAGAVQAGVLPPGETAGTGSEQEDARS